MKNSKINFENPIDQEEYDHFESVKRWLTRGIEAASKTSVQASDLRKRYNGNDKNDIPPILEANGVRNVSQEDIALYRKVLSEPYFARLAYREVYPDYTLDEDIYIGQEMIRDDSGYGSDILIHSWTSDIANELLYDKRTKPYEKILKKRKERPFDDDEKYIMQPDLRRMILSEKGQYIRHINEYVSDEYVRQYNYGNWLEAGEQIADKFLLDVLEQKKNENQITNIIRTIQQNQNTVIRLPFTESFIVEGCAGSGKTMIMLHRLSYLQQRNFIEDNSTVVVLTPSEDFNLQVHSLMKDLEIEKMNISNVEQYYRILLKKIDWDETGRVKLRNDDNLPDAFVKEMYSEEMLERMQRVYDQIVESAIHGKYALPKNEIEIYMKRLKVKARVINYSQVEDLIAILDSILLEQTNLQNWIDEKKRLIANLQQTIDKEYSMRDEFQISIDNNKERFSAYLIKLKEKLKRQYEKEKTMANKGRLKSFIDIVLSAQLELQLDDEDYVELVKESAAVANKDKEDSELKSLLDGYYKSVNKLRNSEMKIENNAKYIAEQKQSIVEPSKKLLSGVEEERVERYYSELKGKREQLRDYRQLFDEEIQPYIKNKCEEYGVKPILNQKYYLYLKLSWYSINEGKILGNYLMCIDEAQNLSVNEYKLLQMLHGDHTIFNLYGDLLQNTRVGLGIFSWNEVQKALFADNAVKIYTFAENYRNTNQITTFVNERLKLKNPMKIIGYDGTNVIIRPGTISSTLAEARYERGKTAVIVSEITKEIKKEAELCGFSVGKVDVEGVAVLSINDVKGLEFKTVFVVDEELSYNEKYIAYTRALNRLIVITK